ncbi:MAG: hypothetical protein JWP91_4449 [Fibrobacteres bacterium]|nr:hypothetical protein [Fibrobacterota bacterium]
MGRIRKKSGGRSVSRKEAPASLDPASPKVPGKAAKYLSWGGTVLGILLLALAVWVFGKTLRHYDMAEVVLRLGQIPEYRLAIAVIFVALSYATQTFYDYLSAVSVRLGISPARAMLAAFIGNAFTNNIGFSLLTGTSLRYRFYLAWNYSALEIAQVIALAKLAFCNGLFLFAGLTQLIDPVHLPDSISLPLPPRLLGGLLILPPILLLVWNGLSRGNTLRLGKVRLVRPAQTLLILQMAVSCLHLAFASCTLYYLLPADALHAAGFHGPLSFLGTFMAIKFVVMFVPVPGSLGVFEGTAVALLTPALPDYPVLGGLLAYRLVYYVMPFAVALITLAIYELSARKGFLASMLRRRRRQASGVA